MRVPKEYEMTVRGHIRRLLIMDGGMSNRELSEHLAKIGVRASVEWVYSLRKKIVKEKLHNGLSYTLTTYLQNFIDAMSEADRQLWAIATSKSIGPGNRIYALSQIRENRKAIFDKLFEAGIFEKQLGNLNLRTFMDIVKDASSVKDAEFTIPGVRENPRALEGKSGGGDPSPMGQGLADLVRASADPSGATHTPENSGA